MPLNTLGLVAGIAIARREGVAPDQVARVAFPAAIFPNLALGIILVDRLAQDEAAAEAAAATAGHGKILGPGAAPGAGNVGTSGGGSGAPPTVGGMMVPPVPRAYPHLERAPVIETFKPGDTLTVDPGAWFGLPADATPTYQWYRNAEDIEHGGNAAQYKVTDADKNHWLTVQVTYNGVSVWSPPVPVGSPSARARVPAGAPAPQGNGAGGQPAQASSATGGSSK